MGLPRAQVFYSSAGMRQQDSLQPLNTTCASAVHKWGWLVGPRHPQTGIEVMSRVCLGGTRYKVRGALLAASDISPSLCTPRSWKYPFLSPKPKLR